VVHAVCHVGLNIGVGGKKQGDDIGGLGRL